MRNGFGRKIFFAMWLTIAGTVLCMTARAQGNYEIQVYGADTVEPKNTMLELHSNYTVQGQHRLIEGVYPTYRQ